MQPLKKKNNEDDTSFFQYPHRTTFLTYDNTTLEH